MADFRIHKYPTDNWERDTVHIKGLRRVLKVAVQHDKLTFWVSVDVEDERITPIPYLIAGTGHPISEIDGRHYQYVETVFQGPFVWHVLVQRDMMNYFRE